MFVPRQQYPRELKIALMREIDSGKSTAWVARNYQLSPKRLGENFGPQIIGCVLEVLRREISAIPNACASPLLRFSVGR